MQSTKLSTIIARMDRYQDISTVEEQYKVRDIDEAIRTLRRTIQPPWVIKQTTIALFRNVYVYPVASDHAYLAMLEQPLNGGTSTWRPNLNPQYTSLQSFYLDRTSRNQISEIWDAGTKSLGIRFKDIDATQALVSSSTATNYTASGDASNPTAETVNTIDGSDTVKFTVTLSSGTATMTEVVASLSDTSYLEKYYFRWVYLAAVPTSVTLRFGNDASNYLSKTVTTQFGGQPLKVNAWNLVAMNLNEATVTGTITSTAFDYGVLSLAGAATGTYYIGPAYLQSYQKLDYYYYSFYNIKSSGSSVLDKQFFFNDTTNAYTTSDELVGEAEWIDVITFDAALTTLSDNKNQDVIASINKKRQAAWTAFEARYPDMSPVIITDKWTFGTEPIYDNLIDGKRSIN